MDMVERGVAKQLTKNDMNYDGPFHYISHHEVLKESVLIPCRFVSILRQTLRVVFRMTIGLKAPTF